MRQRQTNNMQKMLMLALLLAGVVAGVNAPKPLPPLLETGNYRMQSYSGGQPLWAWCDAPTQVLALLQYGTPAALGEGSTLSVSKLLEWPKTAAGLKKVQASTVEIGQPDPGAGQIYTPLKLTSGARQGQNGYVHTSNIENTNDPAYRMTRTGEFKLGNDVYRCRYVKDAAFIGVTQKRTVIIWDNGRTATYATRNFDGSAGVYVTGGKPINFGSETGWGFEFLTKDGYKYSVSSGDGMRPKQPPLSVTVYRKGKVLTDEPFLAYSISLPR